jgi:hypothetical protein
MFWDNRDLAVDRYAKALECSTDTPTEDEIATVHDAGTADVLGTWVTRS